MASRVPCRRCGRALGFRSPLILSSFAVCALVQIVYEWDQTLIASNARPLSDAFKATVSAVGTLFFVRAAVQVCVQPFWGHASDSLPRRWLLLAGCGIWGAVTVAMTFVSSWPALMVLRGTAGLGLAAILPVIHHLVGDTFVPALRGRVFGLLGACQMLGGIISVEFATNLSAQEKVAGMAGWRFTFLCTGLVGLGVGVFAFYFLKGAKSLRGLGDRATHQKHLVRLTLARTGSGSGGGGGGGAGGAGGGGGEVDGGSTPPLPSSLPTQRRGCCWHLRDIGRGVVHLLGTPTYLLIFFRSALDGIPMNANALLILWFEYMGYAELHASQLVSVMMLCNCFSSVFFGWMGDEAHNWGRGGKHRISVALVALVAQLCLTVVLFRGGPETGSGLNNGDDSNPGDDYWQWLVIVSVLGLVGDADQQCCDLPLLGDIVHPSRRGLAYGIVDMVQCFFAFLATVVVGLLTEDVFGFVHDDTHPINEWDVGTRERNVKALGTALLVVNLAAMSGSLILYLLMLLTYERDAARLRQQLDREIGSVALDKEGGFVVESGGAGGSKEAAPATTQAEASLLVEEEKKEPEYVGSGDGDAL
jgi:MFS family permease